MIPFELYSITPSVPLYGEIFRIPNYYSEKELTHIRERIAHDVNKIGGYVSEASYPSMKIEYTTDPQSKFVSEKSQWLLNNWSLIRELTEIDDIQYHGNNEKIPQWVDESARGSPPYNKLYPPHTDMGSRKLLTILVPLSDMGDPTKFHGITSDKSKPVSRVWCHEWGVNDAYMFRPSSRSWHSYQNTMGIDRWISNVNLVGEMGVGELANDNN